MHMNYKVSLLDILEITNFLNIPILLIQPIRTGFLHKIVTLSATYSLQMQLGF